VTLETGSTAQSVSVALPNGKSVPANVVGTDPQTDLAVLQVSESDGSGLSPVKWADSSAIVVGEQVVAIGYALNLGSAPTVTTGVVSALDRSIPEPGATISGAIQTDAAVNPGNSGGPLLDLSGNVIGVTTAGLTGTSDTPVQGVNFAISSQVAQPIVQALIGQGHVTRGYLGVEVTDVTPQLAKAAGIGVDHGAGVGQVQSGAPADQAGLKAGDVILKVGDMNINNTGDLTNALTRYGPNQKVSVAYARGNNQTTAMVTLGQRPAAG
jgi:serine protease Do